MIFACSAIALSISGYVISASINTDQKSYELPNSTPFLLVGHSHTACAVDPFFAKSVANLSASGESYFYMGAKVRKFIQSNPDLNTVLIAISNNSVSKELDTWVASDFFIGNFMPKYFALLSEEERETLFLKNRNGYVYTLGKTTFDNMFYAAYKYGKYGSVLGGFERMDGDLDAWERNASIRTAAIVPSDTISALNLQYLEKMVSYLQKNQKEVILIRTPLHASFWNTCKNENLFQSVIREKFPTVKFIDFKNFPLKDDDFHDPEHLNTNGAEKFSVYLEGVLKDMHRD